MEKDWALKRYFLAVVAVSVFVSAWTSSHASTKELESNVYRAIPFGDAPYVGLDTRKAYADALLVYWSSFDNRVPRLSPEENAWLRQELDTRGERLERAINSREYALYSLSLDLDICLSSLRNLKAAYTDAAPIQTEMLSWVSMAKCYSHMDSMVQNLQRAGLSNGKYDGAFSATLSGLILTELFDKVIPSSMADVMGWTLRKN